MEGKIRRRHHHACKSVALSCGHSKETVGVRLPRFLLRHDPMIMRKLSLKHVIKTFEKTTLAPRKLSGGG